MARNSIAIDVGRRRLRAVEVAAGPGNGLVVRQVLVAPAPETLDMDDPQAVGTWIGDRLAEAGFPRGRATVAIGREHVGLKRVTLPTIDDDELPEMVQLAMRRELSFDAADAVIDFVPAARDESSTTVLATALPLDQVDYARRLAATAGLRIERISLRCMGTAALLRDLGPSDEGILGVDVTGEGVELCVAAAGAVRYSRGIEAPYSDDHEQFAASVVTETRRSWVSYRIVQDDEVVRRAIIMGDERVTGSAAPKIGEALGMEVDRLRDHPLVDTGSHDMIGAWPLVGLLLEPALGIETIDFSAPRKAPDLASRRRQRVLGIAGAAAVVLLAGWVLGNIELKRLRRDLAALDREATSALPSIYRHRRDQARLEHLRWWTAVPLDWREHLLALYEVTPPPGEIVLDSWTGTLGFRGVRYDHREKDADKRWSAESEVRIVVDGEASDRAVIERLRGVFVEDERYRLRVVGRDVEGGRRLAHPFTCILEHRPRLRRSNIESEDDSVADRSRGGSSAGGSDGEDRS